MTIRSARGWPEAGFHATGCRENTAIRIKSLPVRDASRRKGPIAKPLELREPERQFLGSFGECRTIEYQSGPNHCTGDHHARGEHEEAKHHATAAREHSEAAHKHTETAHTHTHK
jgi:hypothetical protein